MSSEINIEIDERRLKKLVVAYLSEKLNIDLIESEVNIQTKSAQNYRAEWETANFKAVVRKVL